MAQIVYFLGAVFIGIAYQPVMFMVIGLQCGLWSYCRRIDAPTPRPLQPGTARLRLSAT
jgi:hypothetical protein